MARLRKIKNNYYLYFYDPDRSPTQKSVPLRTGIKSAAEKMQRRLEVAYADGKFDPWIQKENARPLTIQEAASFFLESRKRLRPKTQEAYSYALKGFFKKLPPNLRLIDLTTEYLKEYINDDTVSPSTRRHRHRHVGAFLRWAIEHGHLDTNPIAAIKPPKVPKQVAEFLTTEHLENLLVCIDWDFEQKRKAGFARDGEIQWLKDLILVAVGTGMRLGELVSLRWSGVDFSSGFLTIRNTDQFQTKSGHERSIPLVGDALEVISRRHDERTSELDGPVLTYGDGRPIIPSYASKRFKYYVRLAKLPEKIRFHSLRHTCASWLVMRGVSLSIVQAILGHSSIQVTERYSHLAPDVMTAAMKQAFGK